MAPFKVGLGLATLIAAAGLPAMPLSALTMRECSAAYKSAQGSGTLGGMSWQEFRKTRCGPGAPAPKAVQGAVPERGPAPRDGSGYLPGVAFPSAVAPKYSDETPGKARMHTCLDQYRINKASNANGDLKWIQKGGGYYSECNRRLKSGGKRTQGPSESQIVVGTGQLSSSSTPAELAEEFDVAQGRARAAMRPCPA